MQSIILQACVGPDGILHLDVPVGIHDSELEVTLTVQVVNSTPQPQGKGWPSGFFEETFGSFKDNPLVVDSQGVLEEKIL